MAIAKGFPRSKNDDVEVGVSAVVDRWVKWKDDRNSKEAIWRECLDAFMSEFADGSEISEFRSQRFMPLTFEAIINVIGQAGRALFPSEDFFTAIGDNQQANQFSATRTIYMRNRVEASGLMQEFIAKHLFNLFLYGNGPYMLGWEARSLRAEPIEYNLPGQSATQSYAPKSSYAYDGPTFKSLDLFNFVIDPNGGSREGAVKIYRSFISKEELLDLAQQQIGPEAYSVYDLAQVKKAIKEKENPTDETSDSDTQARRENFGINDSDSHGDRDEIELLWAYGDFAIDDELFKHHIICVADRKFLIRGEKCPYKSGLSPLRMTALIPVQGLDELPYGMGIIEAALPLQELINIRANQVVDAMSLTINPMWTANEDAFTDTSIVSTPGGVVLVDGEPDKSLKRLEMPMQAISGLGEVNAYKAEFVDATGSYKNFGAQQAQKTATEVATSASLMASVVGHYVQRIEKEDLVPILVFWDCLEQQYFDPNSEVFARYEDGNNVQFQPITDQVIYQSYTWRAMGSGFTHLKETRLQQLLQIGVAAAQTQAAMGMDFEEWIKAALRECGRRDVEKLVPGVQEMMQRAASQGQMAPGLPGGAPGQMGQGGPLIAPGSRPPQGMAPGGRGAIPNAGGAQAITPQGGGGFRRLGNGV